MWESSQISTFPHLQISKWSRALFADLHANKARDRDVLAQDADGVLHQLRDRDVGVADRGLLQEAELLVKAVQLALDDLVDDLRGLVLDLVPVDVLLARHDVGGDVL